jgi:predicted nucleic acid-binding protein
VHAVVADTGPIHYLVLIDSVEILPALFERIHIPSVVRDEMTHPKTPEVIRHWIATSPEWLEVHPDSSAPSDEMLDRLDRGERAALSLALDLAADLILIDDRQGTSVAYTKGFRVAGTLRVLQLAAQRGLLDLSEAFGRLKQTNFRYRQDLMDELLEEIGISPEGLG